MTLEELQVKVVAFRDDRDWRKFHTPKNLAQALIEEVGELNSLYLWDRQPALIKVAHEIADIQIYLLSLVDVLGIDLGEAVLRKLVKNNLKYPIERAKGNDQKYSDHND